MADSIPVKNTYSIISLIVIAITTVTLWQFEPGRYILYPFTILGTWFHEMGHGLTAILLGASFEKLVLFSNGSGIAYHTSGNFLGAVGSAIIAAGGPVGPSIAGAIMFAASGSVKASKIVLFILGSILILSVILWVRSWFGVGIILILGILIILFTLKLKDKQRVYLLKFFGIQACLSVFLSIDYLFSKGGVIEGNEFYSDTYVMESHLFLPYWFWGGAMLLFSVIIILLGLTKSVRRK